MNEQEKPSYGGETKATPLGEGRLFVIAMVYPKKWTREFDPWVKAEQLKYFKKFQESLNFFVFSDTAS